MVGLEGTSEIVEPWVHGTVGLEGTLKNQGIVRLG